MKQALAFIGLAGRFAFVGLAADSTYPLARTFELGGEGDWDHVAADNADCHLFASHGTLVEVIDLETGKLVQAIEDPPRVHDIAIASTRGNGFISCGKANTVLVFDSGLATWEGPNAIMSDGSSKRIVARSGHGGGATAMGAEAAPKRCLPAWRQAQCRPGAMVVGHGGGHAS